MCVLIATVKRNECVVYQHLQMATALNEDQIDEILDKPANTYILNGCGWSLIEPITPSNKHHFLQHLMLDEVIVKRERNLKAFVRGLKVLGITDMIRRHPAMTKKLFVTENVLMTPDTFMKLVGSIQPKKTRELQAFGFFKDFVSSLGGELYNYSL